ncbi:MAG TPA: GyrI-like domain-containing protein [Phototrophicaceae bacterium]|jgi:effector-binding domain-containing protein|nr:GyrI-like domain-containing protein [Phototrophicaceae bacterium]
MFYILLKFNNVEKRGKHMAKNVNTATEPKIEHQSEKIYMGIRNQIPFAGMFKEIEKMRKELELWFKAKGLEASEPPFLRYHCIDMKGEMDMEYGIPVKQALVSEGCIKAATIPAGRYVSIIYSGGGYQGNKTLVEWIKKNDIPIDRWDSEKGDNFASRYEQFLTDSKLSIARPDGKFCWHLSSRIK